MASRLSHQAVQRVFRTRQSIMTRRLETVDREIRIIGWIRSTWLAIAILNGTGAVYRLAYGQWGWVCIGSVTILTLWALDRWLVKPQLAAARTTRRDLAARRITELERELGVQ